MKYIAEGQVFVFGDLIYLLLEPFSNDFLKMFMQTFDVLSHL